jgi:acetyl esterase
MNWKTRLVLLFANINKPLTARRGKDLSVLRAEAAKAARLGSFLFDKKIPVYSTQDISLSNFNIRIYKPTDSQQLPVMMYYHGGGFVLYGLDSHDLVCRRLSTMNQCIVVSVDYRMAPEFTFPTAHLDAFDAIKWTIENIKAYGGDATKLILAGDSAGGNLAACMAHKCRDENIKIAAQILIYPWVDGKLNNPSISRNGEGYMLTRDTMLWFQEQYTPDPNDHCNPLVSPIYQQNFADLAPAFVLTATLDPLIDDGLFYAQKLKEAGNMVQYCEYKGLIHGFFNIPLLSSESMKAYEDIALFLKDKIG